MKILNIGPLELVLLFILMVIILGPDDMVTIARKLGRTVYRITHSEIFKTIVATARDLRQIPEKFIEETGLEETVTEIKSEVDGISKDMKEMGLDKAVDEVKATASEVTNNLNEPVKQLSHASDKLDNPQAKSEPVKTESPEIMTEEAMVSKTVISTSPASSSIETATPNQPDSKNESPKTDQLTPKVKQKNPPIKFPNIDRPFGKDELQVATAKTNKPAVGSPSLLSTKILSFNETSFDNDFHFSDNVKIQARTKPLPEKSISLEKTESLSMNDEEFVRS